MPKSVAIKTEKLLDRKYPEQKQCDTRVESKSTKKCPTIGGAYKMSSLFANGLQNFKKQFAFLESLFIEHRVTC